MSGIEEGREMKGMRRGGKEINSFEGELLGSVGDASS